MEELFGLPAHPLLIHFPIVAIPTFAVLALVMLLRPRFRDTYGKVIIGFGFITAVATVLAAQSGQALLDTYGEVDFVDKHKELGETLRLFVVGLSVAIVGLYVAIKRSSSSGRDALSLVASVVVASLAILSLVWTVRTGHEGASSVWGGAISSEVDTANTEPVPDADTTAPDVTDSAADTAAPDSTVAETTSIAPDTTSTPDAAADSTIAAGVAVDGMAIFESNCARCHGSNGEGGRGPSLQGIADRSPDKTRALGLVESGGRNMPSFGGQLSADEITAVVDYAFEAFPAG